MCDLCYHLQTNGTHPTQMESLLPTCEIHNYEHEAACDAAKYARV